jgi:hypothetical protein
MESYRRLIAISHRGNVMVTELQQIEAQPEVARLQCNEESHSSNSSPASTSAMKAESIA